MRFDLFYELSVPAFTGRREAQVFHDTLAELEWADALGFTTAWLVEHHFMPEYSHSSAPELFLAAAAMRTRRLRLGHGIIPLPYHHPIAVAERVATLDILSQGRLELGFGRGFSPAEYRAFGVDMAQSRELTQEALDIIRLAFQGQPVSYAGRHFRIDTLTIIPRVLQSPHPPLWTAAVSPESFELAARLGVGVLVGPFKPWIMAREDIKRYRRAWSVEQAAASSPPPHGARVGMTLGVFCLEDGARARALAAEGFTWFYRQLLQQTRPVLERLYPSYGYYRRLGYLRTVLEMSISLPVLERLGMAVVGDPDHCLRRFRAMQRAGVDHVLCAIGAGVLPTEQVRESMRILAEQVIPRLQTP